MDTAGMLGDTNGINTKNGCNGIDAYESLCGVCDLVSDFHFFTSMNKK